MIWKSINFAEKFGLVDEQWQPKVIAEMNDYQFKIVKLQGDFIWHDHADPDETFIVFEGELRIDFPDGAVRVGAGDMFVVPKGMEHKPFAASEVKPLLIEPRGRQTACHQALLGQRVTPASWACRTADAATGRCNWRRIP